MKSRQSTCGFTLLEMMIVVSVLAILVAIAMPSYDNRVVRSQIVESTDLLKTLKEAVTNYYQLNKTFPTDNAIAGIPAATLLKGNYVKQIELTDGAFHIVFGNKANKKIKDKTLSVRPLYVKGSPQSPISWLCGLASVPEGMDAAGKNLTDIPATDLPINCF